MHSTFAKISRLRATVIYNIRTKFELNRKYRLDAIVFIHMHTHTHTHTCIITVKILELSKRINMSKSQIRIFS